MKYQKSPLTTVIRYEIAVAKIKCAGCVMDTVMWLHKHHIISEHTMVLIGLNAMNYGRRVVERYGNKSH